MRYEGFDKISVPLEGEIVQVTKGSGKGFFGQIFYDVMVRLPNGSRQIIPTVPQVSSFGGIGNRIEFRSNTRVDGSDLNSVKDDASYLASTGDRVIVQFLGGNLHRPIITGYLPHPQQTKAFKNHEDIEPQLLGEYNGIEFSIDDLGQFTITHHGAPTVNFSTRSDASKTFAAQLADSAEISATLLAEPNAAIPNPSLEYPDDEGTTVIEMLDGGGFSIRDTEGQQFLMDRENSQILITNSGKNSLTNLPTFRGETGNGEYIKLNFDDGLLATHATSTWSAYSEDELKITAEGDFTVKILGDTSFTLAGDRDTKIDGDDTALVSGDMSLKLGGDSSVQIAGDSELKILGELQLSALEGVTIGEAVAKITLSEGMVAIKGATGELLDLINQILTALTSMTVLTAVGPSSPPVNAAVFVQIQTLLLGMKGS